MNELRNIIIGFQLGRETSQICYYDRKIQEPVSLATKVGSNLFEFPTTLCKMEGKDEWHFGLEAEYFGNQPGGIYIDALYTLNESENDVEVDGVRYAPWQLLSIFIKESLMMLGVKELEKAVTGLMLTAESLSGIFVNNLKKALDHLGLKKGCCRIQNYGESFYYYIMNQKPELRVKKVALLEFSGQKLALRELSVQTKTRPMLVTLSEKQEFLLADTQQQWDMDFLSMMNQSMPIDGYSSAFLVGNGFDRSWAIESLPRLAKAARRVFSGNNLFVKGACYCAKEKSEDKRNKDYLYLGEDLVRTNVGMEMIVHGVNGYYPLVMAGTNWYDISHSCDFILDEKEDLTFITSAMEGGERKQYAMALTDLPKRPNRTTRLHMEVNAVSAKECIVKVTDMGFGDMFPSTGKTWVDSLKL